MSDPYDDQAAPFRPVDDHDMYTAPVYNAASTTRTPLSAAQTAYDGGAGPYAPQGQYTAPAARGSRGMRSGAIFALTLLLALVFGTGLFAGWEYGRGAPAPAQQNGGSAATAPIPTLPPSTGSTGSTDALREAVIARVQPAVVQVNVTAQNGTGIGSGVILNKNGYIVTNNHVVGGAQAIKVVLYNGTSLAAQLVGTDATDDLAVIKITPPAAGLTVASLGDSSKLVVGQEVLAIGNPLGITQTVTNGIVSALGRNVNEGQGGATIPNAIQTDAPINPGNSGGALVNMQGQLVGIPTLTAIDPEFNTPANGVGFAIPSNRVQFITSQIIASGQVTHTGRAALGVSVESVDANLAAQDNLSVSQGALIVSVTPNGPAAKANLQAGDVIVQVGNTTVNDISSLGDALQSKNPGDSVAVKVYRGNQQLTVSVTLGELQARQG
jgi:S1-C subfamily serine protease